MIILLVLELILWLLLIWEHSIKIVILEIVLILLLLLLVLELFHGLLLLFNRLLFLVKDWLLLLVKVVINLRRRSLIGLIRIPSANRVKLSGRLVILFDRWSRILSDWRGGILSDR